MKSDLFSVKTTMTIFIKIKYILVSAAMPGIKKDCKRTKVALICILLIKFDQMVQWFSPFVSLPCGCVYMVIMIQRIDETQIKWTPATSGTTCRQCVYVCVSGCASRTRGEPTNELSCWLLAWVCVECVNISLNKHTFSIRMFAGLQRHKDRLSWKLH